jgi:transcriptional regulator with XRE-family HTH domain
MTQTQIGHLITRRRELLQLRQQDLSEMSGIAIKTIHLIEKGSGNPSMATIEKIAKVLGLELILQIQKNN